MRRSDGRLDILKIGIIIPCLNEEDNLKATIESVSGHGVSEVLVVDGGSIDKSVEVAKANGAKVIKAPRGRGPQMNAGWKASKADWCLFLHADTQLPPDFSRLITQAVKQQTSKHPNKQDSCWGCFWSIHLTQVPWWQSWLVELGVGLRTALLHLPYGDQALFMDRKALQAVEGFPEWRALEDLDVVRKLNQLSPPAIVPRSVVTSGRKYARLGFWQTIALHQALLMGWAAGWEYPKLQQLHDSCSSANKGNR